MANLSFLCAHLGPDVAAVGAQRALQKIVGSTPVAPAPGRTDQSSRDVDMAAMEGSTEEDSNATAEKQSRQGIDLDELLNQPTTEASLQEAAASVLDAATEKARMLAMVEERKMKGLIAQLLQTQLKRLEIKLRHFEELENMLDKERVTLELQRKQFLQDRQTFYADRARIEEMAARPRQ